MVFKGLLCNIAMLYLDDIVIYSRNEAERAEHLLMMFKCFQKYNLYLNPAKCFFGLCQIKLIGYMVSKKGLQADPDKFTAITCMSVPANVKDVQSIIGMAGYYMSFINHYDLIAEPTGTIDLQRSAL